MSKSSLQPQTRKLNLCQNTITQQVPVLSVTHPVVHRETLPILRIRGDDEVSQGRPAPDQLVARSYLQVCVKKDF